MESPIAYQFHLALRNISPKIWRRVELSACHSLVDLQRAIQISFGWSDEYQHRFCIRHHHLGIFRPGRLLLFVNPRNMTLAQFAFRENERFTYEYNFYDGWSGGSDSSIAVGTRIAARPPHKTERAPFRHSASTLGV